MVCFGCLCGVGEDFVLCFDCFDYIVIVWVIDWWLVFVVLGI